jgi:hypothetical protein
VNFRQLLKVSHVLTVNSAASYAIAVLVDGEEVEGSRGGDVGIVNHTSVSVELKLELIPRDCLLEIDLRCCET